jgi:predicted phosphoribosyltransferase
MPDSPELKQEVEEERRQLKEAVAELREEIDETKERGKRVLVVVTGAAVATKVLLALTRRRHAR